MHIILTSMSQLTAPNASLAAAARSGRLAMRIRSMRHKTQDKVVKPVVEAVRVSGTGIKAVGRVGWGLSVNAAGATIGSGRLGSAIGAWRVAAADGADGTNGPTKKRRPSGGDVQPKITLTEEFHRIVRMLAPAVTPVHVDKAAFNELCHFADVAWLKVSYIRYRARLLGPFPRRQDLRVGTCYIGTPPNFARKFVVSHAWASEAHPSPSGDKMRWIAQQLDQISSEHGGPADDDDCVFFDYCSLPRVCARLDPSASLSLKPRSVCVSLSSADLSASLSERTERFARVCTPCAERGHAVPEAYYTSNNLAVRATQEDRTRFEKRVFVRALTGMTRLYAFHECKVLVVPDAEVVDESAGWGRVNTVPFENRGWVCRRGGSNARASTLLLG
jgi:hypothetical protein